MSNQSYDTSPEARDAETRRVNKLQRERERRRDNRMARIAAARPPVVMTEGEKKQVAEQSLAQEQRDYERQWGPSAAESKWPGYKAKGWK